MARHEEIEHRIFSIDGEQAFNAAALDVFQYQYAENTVYSRFVDALKIKPDTIEHYQQIPFLPIEFFKTHTVITGDPEHDVAFTSSATTGSVVSTHDVKHAVVYERSFLKTFEQYYGPATQYCILALLPNYLLRSGSSLVYMADRLIRDSQHPDSGFFLDDYEALLRVLERMKTTGQKTILLGVSYALLDLAERNLQLGDQVIVMETGGMKGRRREMIKEELYEVLTRGLGVKTIHSEYGMTELLSQAYSQHAGIFSCPPWMKVLIRDANDPFMYTPYGRSGGINVIDLANLYSCAFIATKDLGKLHASGAFEVLGRFDNSDIRGCNLMIG